MPLWRQLILTLGVLAAGCVLWALYVPAARPLLDRAGLLGPMQRIGIVAEQPAGQAEGGGGWSGGRATTVVAMAPERREMQDIVTAIGTARGIRSVTLASEITGRVAALHVASGQEVAAGTVLVELDADAARIAVDRARLMLADAEADLQRLQRLQDSGTGTELARQEAELAERTAALALREAEFELSRHSITAPVDGWVGLLAVETGDLVSQGTEIARIEDRSSLLVEFRVPERVVSRLAPGTPVAAAALADPDRVIEGEIIALDNRVDEASRSLRVQAAIPNADDRLRAGMAIGIELAFAGDPLPSVDPLAVQWSAEGAYVWAVRAGKAVQVPVQILQRNAEAVLLDAAFEAGDLVVIEGGDNLRPGASVTLAPEHAT
ncbi:efflux RND transporter periplasmic adaptor subunit [Frigidibacter oleivorans]|uniref:efflux RND transporter periplasmic adaptor subunit n=1 Tax=Frigidibacter oleivorans TaxID=2487129 RepID=UPI000F8EB2BA|nr:efflux RND transporter periplasmic adaptor subunit [Frigidibacter oleivorans]